MNRKMGVAALLGAALLSTACGSKPQNAQAAAPTGVTVSAATAEAKTIPVELRAIGNVVPMQSVDVKSQVNAQVLDVHFTEGQDVKKGQLLFTLDSRQLQADLARAEANLAKNSAEAANAQTQANRYQELFKNGVVAKQQLDAIVASAQSLTAAVQADKAAVENARVQLSYAKIYAPIDGRTGDLLVHPGNIAKANDVPLVKINQVTPIEVSFAIPEQNLMDVKRKLADRTLKVQASPKGQEQNPVQGKVNFIDNAVDTATGTIKIKAAFENKDRQLWPGQFADVVLTLAQINNAIVVPKSAVQVGQSGQYVYVVNKDKKAEVRKVAAPRNFGELAVVDQGLNPGEVVVTEGQMRITPGAVLQLRNAPQQAENKQTSSAATAAGPNESIAR